MKRISLAALLLLFTLAPVAAISAEQPTFRHSAAFRALSAADQAAMVDTYRQMVDQTVDEYLSQIPAPHTPEQGRAVEGVAVCVADATMNGLLRAKGKPVDDASTRRLEVAVEACGKRVKARLDAAVWEATPKLDVIDFILDYDSYHGQPVAVTGRLQQRGQLTFLYQAGKSDQFVLVDTSELPRADRKRLLTECGKGCSIQVVGTASQVMAQKGLAASGLR